MSKLSNEFVRAYLLHCLFMTDFIVTSAAPGGTFIYWHHSNKRRLDNYVNSRCSIILGYLYSLKIIEAPKSYVTNVESVRPMEVPYLQPEKNWYYNINHMYRFFKALECLKKSSHLWNKKLKLRVMMPHLDTHIDIIYDIIICLWRVLKRAHHAKKTFRNRQSAV